MSVTTASSGSARRVLHVNDCAHTVENLLRVAHARGLDWSYLPLAATGRQWHGVGDQLRRAALGADWLARLGWRSRAADLLHVHFATVYRHTRWVPRPYVLHVHGTDVRTLQYDDRYRDLILRALDRAVAVCYSTPELAEHVLPRRPDALYVPVPIDVAGAPTWSPHDGPPRVLFASRWDGSKGLDMQLVVAQELMRAVGGRASVLGLDWGTHTAEARALGVGLVRRRDHAGYLRLLSGASVVVGQSAGILAASELEALAIGVPLVMAARHDLYSPSPPPVLDSRDTSPAAIAEAVIEALAAPEPFATKQAGRAWVTAHHEAGLQVDLLLRLYALVP